MSITNIECWFEHPWQKNLQNHRERRPLCFFFKTSCRVKWELWGEVFYSQKWAECVSMKMQLEIMCAKAPFMPLRLLYIVSSSWLARIPPPSNLQIDNIDGQIMACCLKWFLDKIICARTASIILLGVLDFEGHFAGIKHFRALLQDKWPPSSFELHMYICTTNSIHDTNAELFWGRILLVMGDWF